MTQAEYYARTEREEVIYAMFCIRPPAGRTAQIKQAVSEWDIRERHEREVHP